MFKVVFSVLFLLDGVLASPITLRAAGAFFSPPLIAASALSPPETFQSVSRDLRSEETRQSAAPLPVTLSETLSSLTPVLNNVENILVSLTGSAGDLFSTFDSPPSQVQGALEILTSQFGTLTSGMNSAHVRLNEAHTPDFSSTQDFLTKIKTIVLRVRCQWWHLSIYSLLDVPLRRRRLINNFLTIRT
ncbi:unnamed protein product [Mycena citricolor]|uniref:Uncharacterized protein n=1 Tax=Mycena citricolor TaxID=2018698 RepID=A0AAD2HP88_9AGAR|nr:unnamed protein product [Mycena citricolor]